MSRFSLRNIAATIADARSLEPQIRKHNSALADALNNLMDQIHQAATDFRQNLVAGDVAGQAKWEAATSQTLVRGMNKIMSDMEKLAASPHGSKIQAGNSSANYNSMRSVTANFQEIVLREARGGGYVPSEMAADPLRGIGVPKIPAIPGAVLATQPAANRLQL